MNIKTSYLAGDAIHTLALYSAGNPQGLPIICLHGGPGAGCDLKHFDRFDLQRCFVILHDQRGCGQSTPLGCLQQNTTWDLVADIEKIRTHFKLEKVLLCGGSWGSTLALTYAETHPDHVLGLVLRSICLAKKSDHRWLYEFGANQLFPQAWQDFIANIKKAPLGAISRPSPDLSGKDAQATVATQWGEGIDIVQHYQQLLNSNDLQVVERATLAWNNWAVACLGLPPMLCLPEETQNKNYLITMSCLETHYFSHHAFLEENQLLQNIHRIQSIKSFIIHGEKDYLCPVANAVELHQAWPGSELILLPQAGHLSSAEGMEQALRLAVNYFLDTF
jgi:proline iminopeptidase